MNKLQLFAVLYIFSGFININAQNISQTIKEINTVCVSENDIWLGTNAGLVRRNIDNNLFVTVFNTTNSKIISNKVFCIEPDNKNIWVGTDKGLSRFDGYSWESFTPDQDFQQLKIFDIAIGGSELWLGTNEGLWIFKDGHIRRVFRDKYNNQDIPKLFIDRNKRLWFIGKGEKKGLYKIENGKFSKIIVPGQIFIDYPILEEAPGILWFSGKGGVVRYSQDEWKEFSIDGAEQDLNCGFVKFDAVRNIWFNVGPEVGSITSDQEITKSHNIKQDEIFDIFFDSENNPYIIGNTGIEDILNQKSICYPKDLKINDFISSHLLLNKKNLLVFKDNLYYFANGTFSRVIVDSVLSENSMKYIQESQDHIVFVGTKEGVTVIKEGRTVHYNIPQQNIKRFIDSAVYGFPALPQTVHYNESVFDESRKCYWVSADSLYRLFNRKWENQGICMLKKPENVSTVFIDFEKRIWALGADSNVYHRIKNEWVEYKPGKELIGNHIIGTSVSDTAVLIIYGSGISKYSGEVWKKYPTDLISGLPKLFDDGKVLWGDKLEERELIKFENGFWIRKKFSALPGNNNKILGTFRLDTTGTYIVTSYWIIKMSGKDYNNFFRTGSEEEKINCYTTDGDKRIVIGMTNGLSLWTGKFWISLTAEDGLPSDNITGLYITSGNLLLVSHTAGISTIDLNFYD